MSYGIGRYYVAIPQLKTYADAQLYCDNNYGTTLATVVDEFDALQLYIARVQAGITENSVHGVQLFVGLQDRDNEGIFRYIDGTACPFSGTNKYDIRTCLPPSQGDCATNNNGDCSSFASYVPQWNGGEPNNANNEDCVIMTPGYSGGKVSVGINDGGCFEPNTRYFACNWDPFASQTHSIPDLFGLDADSLIIGLMLTNILMINVLFCICCRAPTKKASPAKVKGVHWEAVDNDMSEQDEEEAIQLK